MAESFKAGELPFWDRHVAMGFPLVANFQSGSFYPLHLLYLVLPFFDATRAIFISHYLIAAIGSYMLCRQWSWPFPSSCFCGKSGNSNHPFWACFWSAWFLLI